MQLMPSLPTQSMTDLTGSSEAPRAAHERVTVSRCLSRDLKPLMPVYPLKRFQHHCEFFHQTCRVVRWCPQPAAAGRRPSWREAWKQADRYGAGAVVESLHLETQKKTNWEWCRVFETIKPVLPTPPLVTPLSKALWKAFDLRGRD